MRRNQAGKEGISCHVVCCVRQSHMDRVRQHIIRSAGPICTSLLAWLICVSMQKGIGSTAVMIGGTM